MKFVLILLIWVMIALAHTKYLEEGVSRTCHIEYHMSFVERGFLFVVWPAATTAIILNALKPLPPKDPGKTNELCERSAAQHNPVQQHKTK